MSATIIEIGQRGRRVVDAVGAGEQYLCFDLRRPQRIRTYEIPEGATVVETWSTSSLRGIIQAWRGIRGDNVTYEVFSIEIPGDEHRIPNTDIVVWKLSRTPASAQNSLEYNSRG